MTKKKRTKKPKQEHKPEAPPPPPPHPDGLISIKPRCPDCGSTRTIAMHSRRVVPGIEYQGKLCHAQKQGRRCNDCGKGFAVVKIGAPVAKPASSRVTGPTPPPA